MRRIGSAQIVAVIRHVLTEVVGEIVAAIVAMPAGNVRADHHSVPHFERNALEVGILAVPANGGYRADIFVPLNDWETDLLAFAGACILSRETLVGVFVGPADT